MDAPPSLSSAVMTNFDQQHPQVIDPYSSDFGQEQYNPSMSKIRSLEDQPQPDPLFEAGTVERAIGQPTEIYGDGVQEVSIGDMACGGGIPHYEYPGQPTDTFGNGDQAPSIGSMVREENSQTAGGNFSYDVPPLPSIGSMVREANSQTAGGNFSHDEPPLPSIGSMVREANSQTAGGNFSYDAQPSRSDVGPRDASHTGGFTGDQNLPEGNYEEVSLTGRNFGRFYPMALQTGEEHN